MGRAGEGQGLQFGHVDFEMTLRTQRMIIKHLTGQSGLRSLRMGLAWRCLLNRREWLRSPTQGVEEEGSLGVTLRKISI